MSPALGELGWDTHFATSFEAYRSDGLVPGRIGRQDRDRYLILTQAGMISARLPGRYRHQVTDPEQFPAVGDWVALRPTGNEGEAILEAVLTRKGRFIRKAVLAGGPAYAPGRTEAQVLAANIDTAFLVSGLNNDFNLRRIERYLTVTWDSGAMPVIVLNKSDLCDDVPRAVAKVAVSANGVPIHPVSARTGDGLDAIRGHLGVGLTVAFLGSSGVGKSSLINRLLGEERQDVTEIRAGDGRGRHTTVVRELIVLPEQGVLLDTPGLRELYLWDDEGGVEKTFGDVEELAGSCRFNDCRHKSEPDCAVLEAIDEGRLDPGRLRNYRKMLREQEILAVRRAQRARMGMRKRRR